MTRAANLPTRSATPDCDECNVSSLPARYANKVVNADVMDVLADLPDQCMDVVYADPDYNVGVKYDGQSYTTSWDDYLDWYCRLAEESVRVLKDDGNLFLINYPRQNAYLRVMMMDAICAAVHDYVWIFTSNIGHSPKRFTTAHRSILHCTKSNRNKFYKEAVAQPYQNPRDRRIKERIRNGHTGRMPYSWLDYNLVKNTTVGKSAHPCQIPEGLSDVLLRSCAQKGDTVFVLFGGSGSEVCQVQQMGCTFLTCDLNPDYCHLIRERLKNEGTLPPELRHPVQAAGANGSLQMPLL